MRKCLGVRASIPSSSHGMEASGGLGLTLCEDCCELFECELHIRDYSFEMGLHACDFPQTSEVWNTFWDEFP